MAEDRKHSVARNWCADLTQVQFRQPRIMIYPLTLSVGEKDGNVGAEIRLSIGVKEEKTFLDAKAFLRLCRWGLTVFDFPHDHEYYSGECRLCGEPNPEAKK